jgi:tripartite-type tricarboxylate transporter receptor subunit TctC
MRNLSTIRSTINLPAKRPGLWVNLSLTIVFKAGLMVSAGSVSAQTDFPSKPIRMMVPFTAGSGADGSARILAEQMQRSLGQSVLVENRPGGSGAVAAIAVKQAAPDGHTIMVASNSPMSVNPIVMKNPGYDAVKDFKAVHGISRSMNVWYASNESPFKNIGELIAAGKAKSLNIGSYSAGYQLGIAWLSHLSHAKLTYVPYKGQSQVINDVIGRQLDAGMGDLGGALPLIKSGKIRALAVSGEARHPALPDVMTIRELYPDYTNYAWTSFYVRSETPAAAHAKLVEAMKKGLASKEAANYFIANGSEPMVDFGPERMTKYQLDEIDRFRKIADAAGIKAE